MCFRGFRKIEIEGAEVTILKVKKNGLIDIKEFKNSIKGDFNGLHNVYK